MTRLLSPFGTEPIEEVPLPKAPLVHVLAQIRFPIEIGLTDSRRIEPLHRLLRKEYPLLKSDQTTSVVITANGVSSEPQIDKLWRMRSKSGEWQVSIGESFLTVDTSAYTSRIEFCRRMKDALLAFAQIVDPAVVERVGLRYVDRLDQPGQVDRLSELVYPEVDSLVALSQSADGTALQHSILESVFVGDESNMLVRWGILPAGAMIDPAVAPSTQRSWLLDIDVFKEATSDFDANAIVNLLQEFSKRSYRFFRWAVRDQLLIECGGKL